MSWLSEKWEDLTQGITGSKDKREAKEAAERATNAQKEALEDTKTLAKRLEEEAKAEYEGQLSDIEKLYQNTLSEIERSRAEQNTINEERLTRILGELETRYQEIEAEMQSAMQQIDDQITAYEQKVSGQLDTAEQRSQSNLDEKRALSEDASKRIGNNRDAIDQELDRIKAMGSRPEGLDAALTEIESGYRDAEARLRRENAGNVSEGAKLAIDFSKSRDKAKSNAELRKNWMADRASLIGNLTDQSNAGTLAARGVMDDQIDSELENSRFNTGRRLMVEGDIQSARVANRGTWLGQKLDAMDRKNNASLQAVDTYGGVKANNARDTSNRIIGNLVQNITGKDSALTRYQNMKLAGNQMQAVANSNAADVYGKIAAANLNLAANSRGLLGDIGSLLGNIDFSKVGDLFKGIKFGGGGGGGGGSSGGNTSGIQDQYWQDYFNDGSSTSLDNYDYYDSGTGGSNPGYDTTPGYYDTPTYDPGFTFDDPMIA